MADRAEPVANAMIMIFLPSAKTLQNTEDGSRSDDAQARRRTRPREPGRNVRWPNPGARPI